ncbi:MAG: hypothetical protein K0R67_3165 [Paenibacillus sp.]|nr:hypothetical protein [Paenibacillus sp.]
MIYRRGTGLKVCCSRFCSWPWLRISLNRFSWQPTAWRPPLRLTAACLLTMPPKRRRGKKNAARAMGISLEELAQTSVLAASRFFVGPHYGGSFFMGGVRFGTYGCCCTFPNLTSAKAALFIRSIGSAYRLWIDGEEKDGRAWLQNSRRCISILCFFSPVNERWSS